MFRAVLHGKVRANFTDLQSGGDWRSFYRSTEDFLTAAVFSRLTYLPAPLIWSVILRASIPVPIALPEEAGEFVSCEFWPRWKLTTDQESLTKEPDAFMRFRRVNLLVEAKATDNSHQQYPDQWAAEIAAYQSTEDADTSVPVWLLAIGGLGEEPSLRSISTMRDEALHSLNHNYSCPSGQVRLAACSWRKLLDALLDTTKMMDNQAETATTNVIGDLVEILRFHGVRHSCWLRDLSHSLLARYRIGNESSLVTMESWSENTRTILPWIRAAMLYRISDQSIATLGEMVNGN